MVRVVFYYWNVPCLLLGLQIFIVISVRVSERVMNPHLVIRMNMPHDDDEKCKEFQNNNQTTFVMSRTLDHNSNPWEWSECSRSHVTHFIE